MLGVRGERLLSQSTFQGGRGVSHFLYLVRRRYGARISHQFSREQDGNGSPFGASREEMASLSRRILPASTITHLCRCTGPAAWLSLPVRRTRDAGAPPAGVDRCERRTLPESLSQSRARSITPRQKRRMRGDQCDMKASRVPLKRTLQTRKKAEDLAGLKSFLRRDFSSLLQKYHEKAGI